MLGMTLAVCWTRMMGSFGSDDALLLAKNLNYLQQMLDYSIGCSKEYGSENKCVRDKGSYVDKEGGVNDRKL